MSRNICFDPGLAVLLANPFHPIRARANLESRHCSARRKICTLHTLFITSSAQLVVGRKTEDVRMCDGETCFATNRQPDSSLMVVARWSRPHPVEDTDIAGQTVSSYRHRPVTLLAYQRLARSHEKQEIVNASRATNHVLILPEILVCAGPISVGRQTSCSDSPLDAGCYPQLNKVCYETGANLALALMIE
ncbi:hypothetical protein BC629DRAFT_416571 [Irpex lacteus]|nr:hypothetical protein BC629DRAFT_416571 [Irpex lacteus]